MLPDVRRSRAVGLAGAAWCSGCRVGAEACVWLRGGACVCGGGGDYCSTSAGEKRPQRCMPAQARSKSLQIWALSVAQAVVKSLWFLGYFASLHKLCWATYVVRDSSPTDFAPKTVGEKWSVAQALFYYLCRLPSLRMKPVEIGTLLAQGGSLG